MIQTAIGGVEVLELADVDEPAVERGGLLLRATAIGMNFHDVEARRRGDPGMVLPGIPGTDVVGIVQEVGEGVTGFAPGDRIVALTRSGGYAEYVSVRAQTAVRVPDGVSDQLAACAPTAGLSAWFLRREFLAPDAESVVAYAAAGAVGHWLGALLREHPGRKIGIVSSPEKADQAKRAGYDIVLNRTAELDLVRAVRRATWGYGTDLVLDAVAGPRFADSFRMLHPGGTVVLYGRAGGVPRLDEMPEAFLDARRNLGLHTWFLTRAVALNVKAINPALDELLALLAAGAVEMPLLELQLSEAPHAQRLMESGSTVGKVVFRP
ncbi:MULTISPECIES: quinone oxidoreductase family protein [unclassified Streptomyces]|uniref:quinone oxidoreductase family protein n=1 Tax=unclassified Streptomyces TaxID=2593676 RepID=UPI00114CB68D|nr:MULTISPECIES: zinc-binding dehydrogenase [unclassified Streptomyces]MYS21715.1 zinc-binding dehydrogenase [Streptomyces sp. SID4948]